MILTTQMLGLADYGSDAESDTSDTQPQVSKRPTAPATKSSLSSLLPPPGAGKKSLTNQPTPNKESSPGIGGLNLPPPKAKSKRRDGPVKITVEALKPAQDDEDEEHKTKKRRLDSNGPKVGAGSSALLAMLPAPKKVATEAPPPPKPLGAAASGGDAGVIVDTPSIPSTSTSEADGADLSFLPPHLRKPRTRPAPSIGKGLGIPSPAAPKATPTVVPPEPEADGVDFFSLGVASSSTAGPSKLAASSVSNHIPSISAAPQVKEFEPPAPTPYDPYPGYYELPSGGWAAYDPEYYKKHWDSWQEAYVKTTSGKEGKGWEGADGDNLVTVDAVEEMTKQQIAERERMKGLTAPPKVTQAAPAPPPTALNQKTHTVARSRHQLSTLLADAFTNRAAIEEKLAEGRRNRKEAGNKYGFF
ncbi:hypothetical protein FRB99_006757 [Tulasnella sp. 403]|nr:hypothetical protein FRB99_006757 [Tulasnella sp. 403]